MSHISHVSGITVRDLLKLDNFEGDISKRENVFSKVFLQIFFFFHFLLLFLLLCQGQGSVYIQDILMKLIFGYYFLSNSQHLGLEILLAKLERLS